jgi:phosphoribosylglycinamide formyltransferase 2
MGVSLVNDTLETPIEEIVEKAKNAANLVSIKY